jgi:hypothetical protein
MTRKRLPRRRPLLPDPEQGRPPETSPQLAAAVLELVDTQLRDGKPPETRATLERLVAAGYTPEGARQLIAHVVISEVFGVMASGERYDESRYLAALRRLPTLPKSGEE